MLRLIYFYQRWISPLLPPRCRYYPSCSAYAVDAIKLHGSVKGTFLATKRVCRCHPFASGGYDPVPEPTSSQQAEIDQAQHQSATDCCKPNR